MLAAVWLHHYRHTGPFLIQPCRFEPVLHSSADMIRHIALGCIPAHNIFLVLTTTACSAMQWELLAELWHLSVLKQAWV